ncbi:MAG: hypothetical protein ABI356_10495 [Steroidobacteraceae bacterium]
MRISMAVRRDLVNGHGLCHSRGARHGIYDVRVTKRSGETVALFRGRCARLRLPTPNETTS